MEERIITIPIIRTAKQDPSALATERKNRRHAARRRERAKRQARRFVVATVAALMLLCFTIGLFCGTAKRVLPTLAEPYSVDNSGLQKAETVTPVSPILTGTVAATEGPAGVEPVEPDTPCAPGKILQDCPLSAELQVELYQVAGEDPAMFGALMAIAEVESGFDADAVGDGGESYGMFQIHYTVQPERLERLGMEPVDLFDPVKGATVAMDILQELRDVYGLGGPETHALFMGYNGGGASAKRLIASGVGCSKYSLKAMPLAVEYTEEAAQYGNGY